MVRPNHKRIRTGQIKKKAALNSSTPAEQFIIKVVGLMRIKAPVNFGQSPLGATIRTQEEIFEIPYEFNQKLPVVLEIIK
jgi:hypothetical protein